MGRGRPRKNPELLDVNEAADILNVSSRTVSRLCAENKICAVKIGFQWRINRSKLLEQIGLDEPPFLPKGN